MSEKTFKQKCIDAGVNYVNARSYKSRHKGLSYEQVIEHYIKNSLPDYKSERLGKKLLTAQGLTAKIIEYTNNRNVIVEFEDGTQIKIRYRAFKESLMYPKYKYCEHVSTFNGKKWFLCTCKKCNGKHMLCIDELKDYICEYGK